ncbi:thioredoxin domain-containing protein [Caldanaerobius polysaccharolyticus]|uniref:thioredoxin domain-containing protein n=1 Tax=Caldanaerobius polysaccharolyticus TaxID=44256 RepID=UPI00068A5CA6|nr:DUF255 domain-containing protein [Caldanaerobius polysaccharolyticus]
MSKTNFRFSPRPNDAHRIKWRQWGDEAFKEAKQQDKPVLLSISAVWCHWCHVMDETSYSDDKIIDYINKNFIPVRVDTDQRPDVNERYNMGGWPSTVVLTPGGRILNGATYIPPEALYDFLKETADYYHEHKPDAVYEGKAKDKKGARRKRKVYKPTSRGLLEGVERYVMDNIRSNYDDLYGGFGLAPKFPYTEVLDYLVDEYARTKDDGIYRMLDKTLNNMADGDICDKQQGGFFRYSTARDWSMPHYEKLLEDNAALVDVYLKAYQVMGVVRFKDIAEKTLDYVTSALYDRDLSAFYGSQDADEEFYKLSLEERKRRKQPYIDKNVYVSWNARAVSALFRAWAVLEKEEYKTMALKTLDFLNEECFRQREGYCRYYDGKPHNYNILKEQVYMAMANLDGFQYTGDRKYINKAKEVADIAYSRFYDEEEKVFAGDVPEDQVLKTLGDITQSISDNSFMAWVYVVLNALKGDDKYKKIAGEVIRYFSDMYTDYGIFSTPYVKGFKAYVEGIIHVSVVGDENKSMAKDVLKLYAPDMVVEQLDIVKDSEIIETRGYDRVKIPAAYVCVGTKCMEPAYNTKELLELLTAVYR